MVFTRKLIDSSELSTYAPQANAISYAWDAIDRQEYILGHENDSITKFVTFELGSEWNIARFQLRLAQICEGEHIWIDRLCLPQRDDKLRSTLLKIPIIYSMLRVVILLPRSYCHCLRDAWSDWEKADEIYRWTADAAKDDAEDDAKDAFGYLKYALLGAYCPRANGSCIWDTRIWPFQELQHAQNFRLVWAEEVTDWCSASRQALSDLDPDERHEAIQKITSASNWHGHLRFYRSVSRILTEDIDLWGGIAILEAAAEKEVYMNATFDVPTSLRSYESKAIIKRVIMTASLLLGRQIRIVRDPDYAGHFLSSLLRSCEHLLESSRSATEVKDYVLSVFSIADKYRIPKNYRKMPVWDLLENALGQLANQKLLTSALHSASHDEFGHELLVLTRNPGGLLNSVVADTARWSARYRYNKQIVNDSRDVFFTFGWSYYVHIPKGGRIPLRYNRYATSRYAGLCLTYDE